MAESTYQCIGARVVTTDKGKALLTAHGHLDGPYKGVKAVHILRSREQAAHLPILATDLMKSSFRAHTEAALRGHEDFPKTSGHPSLSLDEPHASIIWTLAVSDPTANDKAVAGGQPCIVEP